MQRCAIERSVKGTGGWVGVVLADPAGKPTINSVDGVPDTGSSASDGPRRRRVLRPAAAADTRSQPALGRRSASRSILERPDRVVRVRDRQGASSRPCKNPSTFAGLEPGTYALSVVAVDHYGARDATPAQAEFTITRRPLAAARRSPDTRRRRRPRRARQLPGGGQLRPEGRATPTASATRATRSRPATCRRSRGETSVVKVVSGEVFVKLPTRTALGFDGLRAPLQATSFVPLKGVASIPLGVDRRHHAGRGRDRLGGQQLLGRRPPRQAPVGPDPRRDLPAQAEAREGQERVDPDRREPAVAARRRGPRASARPPKGTVVRSISMVVKGYYRTLGGASTSTARSATFNTVDRCDGTLTQVGKGRVTLAVKGRRSRWW